MAVLIFNRNELLLAWAARQIPHAGTAAAFGPAQAVGVATGPGKSDRLMAVVVFHDYRPIERTCQLSAAASDPRWATRRIIREILAFPFLQYGCNLVWTATPHDLERVVKFNEAIGFRKEATLADRYGPNRHAVICRMKLKDYKHLYLKERGAEKTAA